MIKSDGIGTPANGNVDSIKYVNYKLSFGDGKYCLSFNTAV